MKDIVSRNQYYLPLTNMKKNDSPFIKKQNIYQFQVEFKSMTGNKQHNTIKEQVLKQFYYDFTGNSLKYITKGIIKNSHVISLMMFNKNRRKMVYKVIIENNVSGDEREIEQKVTYTQIVTGSRIGSEDGSQ